MKTSTMPGPPAAIARRLDWKPGDILTDSLDPVCTDAIDRKSVV